MTGRRWLWIGALALLALALGACGSRAVGDSPCARLCEDIRQSVIDNSKAQRAEAARAGHRRCCHADAMDAAIQAASAPMP